LKISVEHTTVANLCEKMEVGGALETGFFPPESMALSNGFKGAALVLSKGFMLIPGQDV
jgi:hypothetical protein